jgi:hypothetical protein
MRLLDAKRLALAPLPFALFFVLLLGHSALASACMSDPCECCSAGLCWSCCSQAAPNPGETTVIPFGAHRALVRITGFASLGMAAADQCVTALGEVGGVDQVRSVKAFDGESGALLPELPFVPNANSGPSFAEEASAMHLAPAGAPWQGFLTEVQSAVPKGKPVTLLLDVTLKNGVSMGTLADQLRSAGIVGTAKTSGDGTVDPQHLHFRNLGLTTVSIAPRPGLRIPAVQKVQP